MKHNSKLEKMWFRQRPRSPNCLLNLTSYNLSIEEKKKIMTDVKSKRRLRIIFKLRMCVSLNWCLKIVFVSNIISFKR